MDHYSLKKILFFIFLLLFQINVSCNQNDAHQQKNDNGEQNKKKIKVGAWYFGGWSFPPDENGYTFHISPTLVNQFSEREPIWGWREDNPEIMIDQINYAANAGFSFWGFCWYENTLVGDSTLMNNLNNALALFLDAPNSNRLQFLLLSCQPVSSVNWEKLCDKTIAYFKKTNYLKVDGKPVMIFFNTDEIIEGMGGLENMKEAINFYREKAKKEGFGEILLGARVTSQILNSSFYYKYKFCGFDFLTTYNQSDIGRISAGPNDYENLEKGDKKAWDLISSMATANNMKYLPTMSAGYDMRPWAADHPTLPSSDFWYTGVTPERIAKHLNDAIYWVQSTPPEVLVDDLLIIYAWNEYGEGAWLTPTKSEGTARLDAIKKVINSN